MLQLSQFHRCWANATTVAPANIAAATAAASIADAAAIFAQRAYENLRSPMQQPFAGKCLMHSHKKTQRMMVDLW